MAAVLVAGLVGSSGVFAPSEGGPAGASAPPAYQLATVMSAMRGRADGSFDQGLCVAGVLPRGTPVILASVIDGRRCAMVSAEPAIPPVEMGACSALDGACEDAKWPLLAIIGAKEVRVRPATAVEVVGEARERAARAATSALPVGPLQDPCSGAGRSAKILPTPRSVVRPFGADSTLVLVDYRALVGDWETEGPLVAITPTGAMVPWGLFTERSFAFYVNDRPHLWASETAPGCGHRREIIYMEEGGSLRKVLQIDLST
jgi:hypothetical protein